MFSYIVSSEQKDCLCNSILTHTITFLNAMSDAAVSSTATVVKILLKIFKMQTYKIVWKTAASFYLCISWIIHWWESCRQWKWISHRCLSILIIYVYLRNEKSELHSFLWIAFAFMLKLFWDSSSIRNTNIYLMNLNWRGNWVFINLVDQSQDWFFDLHNSLTKHLMFSC